MFIKWFLLLSFLLFTHRKCAASKANKFLVDQRPNIIFLMVDDLGFNDVSWRDPRMQTPTLEKLAFDKHTVILNQSYVNQECSPTRSSFLTGLYPHHVGVQDGVFRVMEPSGVPTWFKFLPEDLKALGYGTYLVGKWHLGYCNESYLPTSRGFDKHFGIYQAMADHYTHVGGPISRPMRQLDGSTPDFGLDFWYQNVAQWGYGGRYSTEIYVEQTKLFLEQHDKDDPFFLYLAFQAPHFPLQVPTHYTSNCKQKTKDRRILCGMVNAVDAAVDEILQYLKANGLYENTIIMFSSDNGGAIDFGSSNWPLRGAKFTLWEGGTRTHAFVHSPINVEQHAVREDLFHVVDWYATIMAMASGENDIDQYGDGYNQWEMITKGTKGKRNSVVYNYAQPELGTDEFGGGSGAAVRVGKFKLIVGNPGFFNDWYEVDATNINWRNPESYKSKAPLDSKVFLFDLEADPIESNNLAEKLPEIRDIMLELLKEIGRSAVPSVHVSEADVRGHPSNFNHTLASGWCNYVD